MARGAGAPPHTEEELMAMPVEQKPKATLEAYAGRPLVTVGPDESVAAALQRMKAHRIRHLVAVEGRKVVGILSRRDIQVGSALHTLELITVRRLMRTDVRVFSPQAELGAVSAVMADGKIGAAVIVDREGAPLGIFTAIDALRELAKRI